MAEPEYPVLRELETKLKLQWVDTDDYMATQRAIIEVTPDHAYLELPRGSKGDKGNPGNAISFQGIVARTSDLPTGLTAADAAKAWVNTATKALHVWNGDQWFTVNNFAGVDADVQQFSQWFAQAADAARAAISAEQRAEYWANEVQQNITGDFATKNYVDNAVYRQGQVSEGVTPDTMIGAAFEGLWHYNSQQAIAWEMPSPAAGFIAVTVSGFSTLQEVSVLTTPIQHYVRRWYNGAWSMDWTPLVGGISDGAGINEYGEATSKGAINLLIPSVVDPTLSYEADHAALVSSLKSRLGTVNTGGKAAVALVADHGTTAFKEWMWAEAKARNIPFTMALAPEVHLDERGDSRHMATNADIKQWISEGLAIASHSGDHGGALGYFDVSRQIQTSKAKLEEKLETTVDCWVQPGYALALGNYDGFGTGQNASVYSATVAGRLLQQTYPVITGYVGSSYVYPGGVDLPVGVRRSLTERKDNQDSVIANIEQAITTGGKHINFCHPYAIPESSDTYVTKSEYIAYLDWLVQKRDAGDLVLLTLPELAVAQ